MNRAETRERSASNTLLPLHPATGGRGKGGTRMSLAHTARPTRTLIAIPVYNEQKHVQQVLERVLEFAPPPRSVLVLDDGSKDATPTLLAQFPVEVIRHSQNRGYGRSMQDAFRW